MRSSIVIQVTGRILRLFGLMFFVPVLVALYYGEHPDILGFCLGGIVASGLGQAMVKVGGEAKEGLRRIEALAVVSATWLLVAHLGAVPYVWVGLAPVDAFFESMSGFTTTGATILVDFDRFGRAIMFWRSFTQWLGGMGVITLFVAILPRLAIDMRQIFFAEAPGPTEQKLTPHLRQTAAYLWWLYSGLTLAEAIALRVAGLPMYDAVCHAMTTLSAGGFSPNPESIMGYHNPAAEWIICGFMFLAGANFALQYRALLGRPAALLRNDEFRAYTGVVVIAAGCLTLLLWSAVGEGASVRVATFQTLSILTTTGFASVDFELWTDQAKVVLLALMFIGGCAGSAAGGPKVLRHVLVARYTLLELRRTMHPRGVLPVKIGGKVVSDEIMRRVLVFFLFYILTFAVCTAVVIGLGADTVTGFTATIATLGNIGPGLSAVGPMANYSHLHGMSKLILTLAMWIGRLEVLTVLALLRPEVWRSVHWQSENR
jgi:trk system potassium uptake protein TrkH